MKRKIILIVAVFLAAMFTFSAVAQDYDDDYAPRRRRFGWKERALSRTLSVNVGLWGALESKTEYEGVANTVKTEDPDLLFSMGAKLWFYRSNWGIGIDAVLLDVQKFETGGSYEYWDGSGWVTDYYTETSEYQKWLIDLDLYYRLPITRNLQAVAGAGLTFIRHIYEGDFADSDNSVSAGYNLKLGGELFIARNWSVSCMFTWHHFQDAGITTTTGGESVENVMKMFSANAQLNLYL